MVFAIEVLSAICFKIFTKNDLNILTASNILSLVDFVAN